MKTKINEFLNMPTRKSMVMSDEYRRLINSTFDKYLKKYKAITKANIIEYLNNSDYSQSSKHTIAVTLCRFGREFEMLKENEINTIKRCFPKVTKEWSNDNLQADDLSKIMETIMKRRYKTSVNLRDALAVALLSSYGMRVGQLTALKPDDIKVVENKIVVSLIRQKHNSFDNTQSNTFKVSLPVNYKVGQYYLNSLILRYKELLPTNCKSLIYGKVIGSSMTNAGMRNVIQRIGNEAKINNLHPHAFRNYVGTKLAVDYGVEVACAMLNHTSINVTKTYLNRESILNKIQ